MKTAITVRLDPGLLAAVRAGAVRENRSLTNFIETALLSRVGADATCQVGADARAGESQGKDPDPDE